MPNLHVVRKQFVSSLCFILSLIVSICVNVVDVSAVSFCASTGFAPPVAYTVGSSSFSVTIADFNSDNRQDLAVGGFGTVSVLLNDGTGRFAPPTVYLISGNQTDITTGDFNNDGKMDIAALNRITEGTVTVFLGTGTGSFGSPIVSSSGGKGPYYFDKGDFNKDGKLDLAVSNTFDTAGPERNIAVLLGNGSGGFTLGSTNLPTEFMRAADFNRDGTTDVVAVGNPSLTIRLGDGMGGLAPPTLVNAGFAQTFTIGDLNHDGNPDIAAMSGPSTVLDVTVILGNGNGTFSAPVIYPVGGDTASFIEYGDVNGDGQLDLVVTRSDPNPGVAGRIFVLLGTGTGTFGQATTFTLNAQQQPWRLAVADLNGDGRADIATSNLFNGNILVLLSTCLTPTPRYDFDGDGKSDISIFRPSSGFWYLLPSSTNSYTFQQWGISADRVVAGDYDGDSKTDLAVYRPSSGIWYVFRSTNNTFVAQTFGTSTDVPVPADYDSDGKTDLAVYRAGTWYIQRSSDNAVISQSFGTASDRPMPADYDGDGKADIAVYRPSEGMWYIQQSANNSFRAQPFGTNADTPITGDFDGDGKADVAVYRPQSGTWYALRSYSSSLRAQRWGVDTDIPVAADYDGDGKTDLAVFRPSDGTWYIIRSSDGSFATQQFGLSSDVPVSASHLSP